VPKYQKMLRGHGGCWKEKMTRGPSFAYSKHRKITPSPDPPPLVKDFKKTF